MKYSVVRLLLPHICYCRYQFVVAKLFILYMGSGMIYFTTFIKCIYHEVKVKDKS
jgi:hypothetical protein